MSACAPSLQLRKNSYLRTLLQYLRLTPTDLPEGVWRLAPVAQRKVECATLLLQAIQSLLDLHLTPPQDYRGLEVIQH